MSTHRPDPERRLRSLLVLFALLLGQVTLAQVETANEPAHTDAERLAERVASLEDNIATQRAHISALSSRVETSEGLRRTIFESQLDKAQLELFRSALDLAREVAEARDGGAEVAAYEGRVRRALVRLPATAFAAAEHVAGRLTMESDPESPSDAVMADQQLAIDARDADQIYATIIDYLDVAALYDIETDATREHLVTMLEGSAADRSVFLEIANLEADKLRTALATLTNDEALASRLSAMEARGLIAADALESIVELMNRLELDTVRLRQQLLASTGQISTDVLDVGFLTNLVTEWSAATTEIAKTRGPTLIFSLFLAAILLLVFIQLGKLAKKIVASALHSNRISLSNLLQRMILSTVRNVIILIGVLVALSQLGISLGPLLAGLGILGFIIGFALQDSLSNFASGLMILFYRPFDVGDFVEVAGVKGKVHAMSMVNTTFLTIDNQKLVVPNNVIWQSVIANYTDQATRRVDLVVGISYDDDIDKAQSVITDVLTSYDSVLEEPEPIVKVGELGDSSVNLIVRPWVATEDYWNTYWDLTKLIKQAFDREGITIPYPQRDIHLIKGTDATIDSDSR
jgi:small conductance mechanosensitive channel